MISFFFIRVLPAPSAYIAVPPTETTRDRGNKHHRVKSRESRHTEPGMNYTITAGLSSRVDVQTSRDSFTETSSIQSLSSLENNIEEEEEEGEDSETFSVQHVDDAHHSGQIDIRGWALCRSTDFWMLFVLLGVLTGVGLMTIK